MNFYVTQQVKSTSHNFISQHNTDVGEMRSKLSGLVVTVFWPLVPVALNVAEEGPVRGLGVPTLPCLFW